MKSSKLVIGVVILVLVAAGIWLLVGSPSSDQGKDTSRTQMSENELYEITIEPEFDPIALNEIHNWIVHVKSKDGQGVENAEISIDGDMPEHNHGLPTAPEVTAALGSGQYQVEGLRFSMPGWWVVDVTVTADGQADTARFNLILQ